MKRFLSLICVAFMSAWCLAASYTVKYKVVSKTSTTTSTTTLNLQSGSASEAVAELVRRGTIRKQDVPNVVILEIRKK